MNAISVSFVRTCRSRAWAQDPVAGEWANWELCVTVLFELELGCLFFCVWEYCIEMTLIL